ncbi:DUF2304 domain-containing protein [Nocardioides daeguensis]|uniref:DUF2304 domain-containing protein n=1 Tax=Nocardioides daeguensis TaxID=908359 RepID=A0ABP6UWR7_9ACTN|nr:DUF2304 domain-containing protein [Nocardioides daeguensis]MBV6725770.1 DUF2304 domain-containing protein [Nocardioides daeguensis]MCR1772715.1 DUF2304 domain-containing protein [Nocardioides daeguensis]
MIIRVFLLASIVLAVVWLLRTRPSGTRLAVMRVAGFLVAAGAAASVIAPGLVTDAAHLVGVREGPNLILYVLVVVFVFTTIVQSLRMRDLERRLAQVVRAQALAGAKPPAAVDTGR